MTHVTAETSLWIASRTMINTRCQELFRCWEVANKTFSPEEIHDLRVATRRLREALSLFAPCYPAKKFTRIKAETKRLTNLLGAMRNTDEALLFFTPLQGLLAEKVSTALYPLLKELEIVRSREKKRLVSRLRKFNLMLFKIEVLTALDRPFLFNPSEYNPFMPVNLYLAGKILQRETRLKQLIPNSLDEKNTLAQHKLRIALKKFRYAFELSEPVIDKNGYKELHTTVKKFQDLLGKIHDLDVFRELMRTYELDPECSIQLADHLASIRSTLHAEYIILNSAHPVGNLGADARELLGQSAKLSYA